jgi:hypothetical protein
MPEQLEKFLPVDRLEVVDVDKTLIRTRELQRVLEADIEFHGIDSDRLRYDRERTSGFDTVRYLRDVMKASDEQLEDIREMFLDQVRKRGPEEFLMPRANEVLEAFVERQLPYLLLTTGGGEWQAWWKMVATELEGHPHHVTSGRHKSDLLVRGFDPDLRSYRFGGVEKMSDGYTGYEFNNFRIVDDHEQAFVNLPKDAEGIWIAHEMEQWRQNKRQGSLGNVAICYTFERYMTLISEAA